LLSPAVPTTRPATVQTPEEIPACLRFGRFELQPLERLLLAEGHAVALGARAYDLLLVLASRAGHLVSKSDLLDLVWPDLVVEESNLHTQMSTLRKVLGGDLVTTVPGRGYRFTGVVTHPDAALARPPETPETSAPVVSVVPVPPATAASKADPLPGRAGRLFGRDADLAGLDAALASPGCVTLVGPGGVGKTRLALACAERWPRRRVWVDLAPLSDGGQVVAALTRALGQQGADGAGLAPELPAMLDIERALVVLDNAEHLVADTASLVQQLRHQVSNVHLLVTSQVPLGLAGERVQRIDPLLVGGDAGDEAAVALLSDRIALADHRVALGAEARPLLADICRQLDGLPLALEMAAARVPLLGLRGVRDALADRFALLTTGHRLAAGRHRTLQAALEWSVSLLGPEEQQLFAALGVFAGGFALELAVSLVGEQDRWTVIDRLATLVDRSLVSASADDPPRYRLLETMRAHALQFLDKQPGGDVPWRARHAAAVLAYVRERTSQAAMHETCIAELDNIGEALAWAHKADPVAAISLATEASLFTAFTPWRLQVQRWLADCEPLVQAAGDTLDLASRCHYWNHYARSAISCLQGGAHDIARVAWRTALTQDDDRIRHLAAAAMIRSSHSADAEMDAACTEMEAIAARHPEWEPRRRLTTLGSLANAAIVRRDPEKQLALRLQELEVAREAGFAAAADAAETNIVAALNGLGRHEEALVRAEPLVRRMSGTDNANLPWAWDNYVKLLLALDRYDDAARELPAAIAACRQCDVPLCVPSLAILAHGRGRLDDALRLCGFAEQAYSARQMQSYGSEAPHWKKVVIDGRLRLGDAETDRLLREGRRLDEATAVAMACDPATGSDYTASR
jgi:predicted ATPase/DNA-binding winged helix-turn-helix (wHTH) protein